MNIRYIETQILAEAKAAIGKHVKLKNIMEWSSGPIRVQEGEKEYYLPNCKFYIALKEVPNVQR